MPTIWRTWLIGAALLGLVGCRSPGKSQPEDPLFLTRTPLEGKPQAGPPVHIAYSQPTMPPHPAALTQTPAEYANPNSATSPQTPVNLPSQQK